MVNGQPRVLGLIPARGGSVGLRRKNLTSLGGHPLIAWSISSSLDSTGLNRVVVSSDDQEILEVSKHYGADILRRPAHLATAEASMDSVISHALSTFSDYEVIVILQPTSPFRRGSHVTHALKLFLASEAECVASIYRVKEKAELLMRSNDEGFITPVLNEDIPSRRQLFRATYRLNGAIYVVNCKALKIKRSLRNLQTLGYEMNFLSSIDIDDKEDLKLANESLLKERLKFPLIN